MALPFELTRIGIDVNLPSSATYDMLLVSTPDYPVGNVSFKFEETPRKITGIQKVAQLFLKILFTQKGTDLLRPNLGTDFPGLVGANLQLDDTETYLEVSDCISDAESQVIQITSLNNDPASMLESIQIVGYDSSLESISLFLQVVTVAGETASVAIPFPELNLPLYSAG